MVAFVQSNSISQATSTAAHLLRMGAQSQLHLPSLGEAKRPRVDSATMGGLPEYLQLGMAIQIRCGKTSASQVGEEVLSHQLALLWPLSARCFSQSPTGEEQELCTTGIYQEASPGRAVQGTARKGQETRSETASERHKASSSAPNPVAGGAIGHALD